MHHAGSTQLDPAAPFTDATTLAAAIETTIIDFSAWFGEWKVRRPKARLRCRTEEAVHKFGQRALQMRHRDAAIDAQPFDLIEHWIVCRVGRVAAKDSARRNHPHRRAASLHRVNLHRRGLRTQSKAFRRVERVLRIARGMAFWNVERV